MHPSSIYYAKPELLHSKYEDPTKTKDDKVGVGEGENETEVKMHTTLQSIRNEMIITELLCYQSLLETQKPYLVNVVRVPALQASLLFSKKSKLLIMLFFYYYKKINNNNNIYIYMK